MGAPGAIQIADRWHLVHNLANTLDAVLRRQEGLQKASRKTTESRDQEKRPATPRLRLTSAQQERREQVRESFTQVQNLYEQGRSLRPVCPDPDLQGYSLLHSQIARFTSVDAQQVRAFLRDDERLYCVEETAQGAIWIYWGDPAYDTPPYDTICFGDLELQEPHTLVVSTLSETRMKVLLDLLHPLKLGSPHLQFETPSSLPKQSRRRSHRV